MFKPKIKLSRIYACMIGLGFKRSENFLPVILIDCNTENLEAA